MTTIPESEMPLPRLELRWVDRVRDEDPKWTVFCEYSLVLRLNEYDIRAERGDDEPKVYEHRASLGGTWGQRTAAERYRADADKVDTPFRDHSHAVWDSHQLGLPIFAVANGRAMRVIPRETKDEP
jgi:hypothetical protein